MEIDPVTAVEADQLAWCEISAHADREQRPGEPERPVASFLALLRHPHGVRVERHWAARDGAGTLVGWCTASWRDSPDNPRLIEVDVAVRPDHRRQGIATALLRPATEHAQASGRDVVTFAALRDSSGAAFLAAHGVAEKIVERRSVLDISALDVAALEKWGAPSDDVVAAYTLVQWRDACPDDLLNDHAALRTAMNDAPRDDLEWEDETITPAMVRAFEAAATTRGDQSWTTCARHIASGRLVALTDIAGPAGWPEWAFQEDTVVIGSHRGHGLGRWIKSANLQAVLADRPTTLAVETWNAGSNQHMLAINDEMGFRPRGWWAELQIPLGVLETSLRS